MIHSLRSGQLSRTDMALLERGYYEDLIRVDRFNSQLWEVYMNKPQNWLDVQGLGLERFTGDFRQKELIPSTGVQTRFGPIHTNRWGMRDRDYERTPPPGTYRIALLGASTVMGWGVGDDEVFEALVERRLNESPPAPASPGTRSSTSPCPATSPCSSWPCWTRPGNSAPGAILHVAAGRELLGAVENLATSITKGVPIPTHSYERFARRAGIDDEDRRDHRAPAPRAVPGRDHLLALWADGTLVP